jgi:hypothetical protein
MRECIFRDALYGSTLWRHPSNALAMPKSSQRFLPINIPKKRYAASARCELLYRPDKSLPPMGVHKLKQQLTRKA